MKVIRKDTAVRKVTFGTLDIGDAFIDEDGDICIKTHNLETVSENTIWLVDDKINKWGTCHNNNENMVRPLKADLTIYEGEVK